MSQSSQRLLCEQLAKKLTLKKQTLATAESCTGGGIGACLTDLAGSSAWFMGGIISYSNAAKMNLLGVSEASLSEHGAVSQEVVEQMSMGACQRLQANLAVAVSGVAGPSGGTKEKPVGTVWIAWARGGKALSCHSQQFLFNGDRNSVRQQTINAALQGLLQSVSNG